MFREQGEPAGQAQAHAAAVAGGEEPIPAEVSEKIQEKRAGMGGIAILGIAALAGVAMMMGGKKKKWRK